PLVDLTAGAALAAGLRTHAGLAVEAAGEDAGDGRLADTARAGEQVGVVQAVVVERVDEGLEHVALAGHFAEAAGAPLSCQNLVGHEERRSLLGTSAGRCGVRDMPRANLEVPPASHSPAHESATTAAPFRA